MEEEIRITDRQVANLREEISRINRQVDLINAGKTQTSDGKHRLEIIKEVVVKIDNVLREI